MDDKIIRNGLTFRSGEKGFVFYDDSRFTGERGRAWAFATVQDAADWLVAQFTVPPRPIDPPFDPNAVVEVCNRAWLDHMRESSASAIVCELVSRPSLFARAKAWVFGD